MRNGIEGELGGTKGGVLALLFWSVTAVPTTNSQIRNCINLFLRKKSINQCLFFAIQGRTSVPK